MKKIINKALIVSILFGLVIPSVPIRAVSTKYILSKIDMSSGKRTKLEEFDTFSSANSKRRQLGRDENFFIEKDGKVLVSSYAVLNLGNTSENHQLVSSTNGSGGYVNGLYSADAAFLGYFPTNKVVQLAISNEIFTTPFSDKVEVVPFYSMLNVSYYKNEKGILKHYISTNVRGSYTVGVNTTYAPNYLKEGVKYYSYDGKYFYTSYVDMLNDYVYDRKTSAVNANNPFYNYYMYLPYRSKSNYGMKEVKDWYYNILEYDQPYTSRYGTNLISRFNGTEKALLESEHLYGANMLLTYGIGKSESADGYSQIAQNKYNLFGHAAYDSSPYVSASGYSSNSASIYDHANIWMSKGYLNPRDWRYNGTHLGTKMSGVGLKYASDAYWGEKNAANYFRFDRQYGGLDYNAYTIGIAKTKEITMYKEANNDMPLYKMKPLTERTFIILGQEGNYYKVQSDAPLNENRTQALFGIGEYDFNKSYGYVLKSDIFHIFGKDINKPTTMRDKSHEIKVKVENATTNGKNTSTSTQPTNTPEITYKDIVVDMDSKDIPFKERFEETNTLFKGETKIKQEGVVGKEVTRVTYKVKYSGGNEESREEVTREKVVLKQPIEKVILKGTKEKEKPVTVVDAMQSLLEIFKTQNSNIRYEENSYVYLPLGYKVNQLTNQVKGYVVTTSSNKDVISTGDRITISKGIENRTLEVVVLGDVNGDGRISVRDIGYVLNHIEGKTLLSGARYKAANLLNTSNITVRAIGKILNHIEGRLLIK